MAGGNSAYMPMEEMFDYLLKVIVIGESSVGKSCLVHSFLTGEFKNPSLHTVGVEFQSTILRLPSANPNGSVKSIKLQLWDTAGQERFRSMTRSYYRSTAAAILCYDVTRRSTFTSLRQWILDARNLASAELVIVLVGNKIDDEDHREVPHKEASDFAEENDLLFVEVSALTGENITQPFYHLSRAVLLAVESGRLNPEMATSGVAATCNYGNHGRNASQWVAAESS